VAVEAWNPRTDPVPLHQWLFPWLEHLVGPLEELYPGIRQKLAAALTAWDPYDSSAKALLQPWHRVRGLGQYFLVCVHGVFWLQTLDADVKSQP
jgi:tuftelin-interacting protein 11